MADIQPFAPTLYQSLMQRDNIDYAGRISALDTASTERQKALQEMAFLPQQVANQRLNAQAQLLGQGYMVGQNGLQPTPMKQRQLDMMQSYYNKYLNPNGITPSTSGGGSQPSAPQEQPAVPQGLNNILQPQLQQSAPASQDNSGGTDENGNPLQSDNGDLSNMFASNDGGAQAPQQTPNIPKGLQPLATPQQSPQDLISQASAPIDMNQVMASPDVAGVMMSGNMGDLPTATNQAMQRALQMRQMTLDTAQKQQQMGIDQQKANIERNKNITEASDNRGRAPIVNPQTGEFQLDNSIGKTPDFPFEAPITTKENLSAMNKDNEEQVKKDRDNAQELPLIKQTIQSMKANAGNFTPGFLGEARSKGLSGLAFLTGAGVLPATAASNIEKETPNLVQDMTKLDPGAGNRGTNMNIGLTLGSKPDVNTPAASFNDVANGLLAEATRKTYAGLIRSAYQASNPNHVVNNNDTDSLINAVNTLYPLVDTDGKGRITFNQDNADKIQQMISSKTLIPNADKFITMASKNKPAPDASIGPIDLLQKPNPQELIIGQKYNHKGKVATYTGTGWK